MPAHVSAADAPQDLWQCHECGWTYPNHHPSAKHRRNHKKHCGKQLEVTSTEHLKSSTSSPSPLVARGSSDDASSNEGHGLSSLQDSEGKYDHPAKPAPHPEEAAVVKIARGGIFEESVSLSGLASNRSFEAVETVGDDSNTTSYATNHDTGHNNPDSTRRPSLAVMRVIWTCRHCGWTYPNAHPSAKHRRKHKKKCGAGAGGSSDDASSEGDQHHQKGAQEDTILKEDSAGLQGFAPLVDSKNLDDSNSVEQRNVADLTEASITEALLTNGQSVIVTTTTSRLTRVTEIHAASSPIRIECPVPQHAVAAHCGAIRSNPGSPSTAGQWQLRSMKSLIQEVVQSKVPLQLESCDSQASLFAESIVDVPEVLLPEKISTAANQSSVVEKRSEEAIDEEIESGDESFDSQIPLNSMATKKHIVLPAAEQPTASVYQLGGETAKRNADWHLKSMKSLLKDSEAIKQGTAVTKATLSPVVVTKTTTYANRAPNVSHPPPAVVRSVDEKADSGSKVDELAVTEPVEEKTNILRSNQLPKAPSPIDSSRQPISTEKHNHQDSEVVFISENKADQVISKKGSKESDSYVSKVGDVDRQDLTASIKQGSEEPQSGQHPPPVIGDEGVNKVVIQQGCDSGSMESFLATNVTLKPSTTSVTQKAAAYRSWSPSLKKPESGSQDKTTEKSDSPKPHSSPGSPEGWVRARVEAFEKMAGVDPLMCHRKSMSPLKNSNPNTPVARKSSQLHESPRDLQDTISHLRHQQNSKRWESEALANVVSPEVHNMI